jgi:PAS domain-containing protein
MMMNTPPRGTPEPGVPPSPDDESGGQDVARPSDAFRTDGIYRLLVESVQDYAIFALDASGRVMTWSTGAARLKGYARTEIIGRHFSAFYSRDDVDARKPEQELEVAARVGRLEDEGWRVR